MPLKVTEGLAVRSGSCWVPLLPGLPSLGFSFPPGGTARMGPHLGLPLCLSDITAAALATGACIVGILCLPLILLLVYKQRQVSSNRREYPWPPGRGGGGSHLSQRQLSPWNGKVLSVPEMGANVVLARGCAQCRREEGPRHVMFRA